MKQKVYLITVARNHSDFLREGKKGITFAMMGERCPNKDDVRNYLEAILEQEMRKQHLPFKGQTTETKLRQRTELKTQFVDFMASVNNTHYIVKELTK